MKYILKIARLGTFRVGRLNNLNVILVTLQRGIHIQRKRKKYYIVLKCQDYLG